MPEFDLSQIRLLADYFEGRTQAEAALALLALAFVSVNAMVAAAGITRAGYRAGRWTVGKIWGVVKWPFVEAEEAGLTGAVLRAIRSPESEWGEAERMLLCPSASGNVVTAKVSYTAFTGGANVNELHELKVGPEDALPLLDDREKLLVVRAVVARARECREQRAALARARLLDSMAPQPVRFGEARKTA